MNALGTICWWCGLKVFNVVNRNHSSQDHNVSSGATGIDFVLLVLFSFEFESADTLWLPFYESIWTPVLTKTLKARHWTD